MKINCSLHVHFSSEIPSSGSFFSHPIESSTDLSWDGFMDLPFPNPTRDSCFGQGPTATQLTVSLITTGNRWTRNGLREGCKLKTLGSIHTVHLSTCTLTRESLFPILSLSLLIWEMRITVLTSLCCGLQKVKQCIAKQFSKCKEQLGGYDSILTQ